jgi:mannosylglycerate hydrolase
MKTVHIISHTHWDREWYLTFQQFRLKLVHLIDKLLDILDEDPEFKSFMLDGQTIVLDDYLQIRPEMEEVLRQHIQDGRILIGPWHILPDMFLVSPEAHIRNLLEGARTARKYGLKMPIGYIPDPFGHPGQVPQILRGFGIEAAALWRGVGDMPAELWWESPDGSKVFLAFLRDSYSNGANLPVHNSEQFTQLISAARVSLAAHSAVNDYLIMLGTDHMEPSPYMSATIAYANELLSDTQIIHSTLPDYIQSVSGQISKLEKSLPTIRGELRACNHSPLLPGVLSTRLWIKQRNHGSQTLLEKWAEPFSVFAEYLIGDKTKKTKSSQMPLELIGSNRIRNVAPIIRQAWRMLMENHPHDSICGCSIDQVHDEMKPRFDQADQIGEEITLQALQALSQATDTQFEDAFSAVVLFNPLGNTHHDLVEVEFNIPEGITAFELIDENRIVIPHEFLESNNEELANLLLGKNSLRNTIGAITEGRVAGAAIVRVKVSRQGPIVTIDAILDDEGQPNIPEWHQAEEDIAKYEADPSVTHFQLIAHSPRASKIRFVTPDIHAFGWRTLWVRALAAPEAAPATKVSPLLKPLLPLVLRFAQSELGIKVHAKQEAGDEKKLPFMIENEHFLVAASQADGTLTITDKQTNTVFKGLNRFVDGGDAGDEYNYSPPIKDTVYTSKVVSLKAFRHRLVPSLEIKYALKVPAQLSSDRDSRSKRTVNIPVLSRISLVPGVARIDVHTEINNLAKDHRLRVHFLAPITVQAADYDGHFEVVRRPIGVLEKGENWVEDPRPEVPQRAFTDVSNGKIGLMIANRGLPEVEVIKADEGAHTEIALTLMRCVGWLSRDDTSVRQGHAGPALETPGGQVPGKWTYDYAIIPHHGNWREAYQQAYAFETSLRVIETGLHEGEIPVQGAFISHSPAEFIISAIKETENGKGWIVRGYNISPETIQLNLMPWRRFTNAMQVNLAEEEIAALSAGEDGSIMIPVSGHEIVSIMFS